MKLLLDVGIGRTAATALRAMGHEVSWVAEWPADPGDEAILERARLERRALIAVDKDFGELVVVRRLVHFGIVRLAQIPALQQRAYIAQTLEQYEEALASGAIVTVERGRTRIRMPELPQ